MQRPMGFEYLWSVMVTLACFKHVAVEEFVQFLIFVFGEDLDAEPQRP